MAQELNVVSSDPENFVSDYADEIEYKFDESESFKSRIKKIEQDLKVFEMESKDSFYFAILYGFYYALLNEKENFYFWQDNDNFLESLDATFLTSSRLKKKACNWT